MCIRDSASAADLPTYAFQHRRYWMEADDRPSGAGLLLGPAVERAADGSLQFTGEIGTGTLPWLADHAVDGTALAPASLFADLALRAGERAGFPVVDELTLEAPLALAAAGTVPVQLTVEAEAGGLRAFAVHARPEADAPWVRYASGALAADDGSAGPEADDEWPLTGAVATDVGEVYDRLAALGYGYGPQFRNVRAAWRRGAVLLAEVELPEQLLDEADGFALHPALLDAALHLLPVRPDGGGTTVLPFSWSGVRLHATGARTLRAVSYTHLDVYKRQLHLLPVRPDGGGTTVLPFSWSGVRLHATGAVSYTHLDVYKRQLHLLPVRPDGGGTTVLPFSWSGVRLHATGAVSYTHLDVYKRQGQSRDVRGVQPSAGAGAGRPLQVVRRRCRRDRLERGCGACLFYTSRCV
nr:polyketide synthase dehydratase domain-containing protein [Streptomyces fragilis]